MGVGRPAFFRKVHNRRSGSNASMYSVFRVRDFQKGDPGVSSTSSRGIGWIKPSAKPQETSSRSKLPDLEGLMLRTFRDVQTELKPDSEIRKYVILLVLDATAAGAGCHSRNWNAEACPDIVLGCIPEGKQGSAVTVSPRHPDMLTA